MRPRFSTLRQAIYYVLFGLFCIVLTIAVIWIWRILFVVVWQPQTVVFPPDGRYRDGFGASVAIEGSTLVVGALGTSSYTPPSIYVYVRSGSEWQLQAQLKKEEFPGKNVRQSANVQAVDISGNTIVEASDRGLGNPVYVYERQGSTWTQQAKLELPQLSKEQMRQNEFTGEAVAIDGDTLVVGAERVAYVYVRDAATKAWNYETQLIAPSNRKLDQSQPRSCNSDHGLSVDISGDTIVVGSRDTVLGAAAHCANVFVRHPTTRQWVHQISLLPDTCQPQQPWSCGGGFGYSVAIAQDTVIVGTAATLPGPFQYCEPLGQDAAYIFERTPGTATWKQTAVLQPRGLIEQFSASRCGFGKQVAISKDTATVLEVGGKALHIFKRAAKTGQWQYQAELVKPKNFYTPSGWHSQQSVAVSVPYVAVGDTTPARSKDSARDAGAFYSLDLETSLPK